MIVLASLLLVAASTAREAVNQEDVIAAENWGYYDVPVHDRPARISAHFDVVRGSAKIRAFLLLREDLDRLDGDLAAGALAQSAQGRAGEFADSLRRTGDYVVALENTDSREAATVRLHVLLDFSGSGNTDVRELPPRRQWAVVLMSSAMFLGIAGFSARKLLRAVRRNAGR